MEDIKGERLLYSCINMRKQLNKLLEGGELSNGEYLVLRNIAGQHKSGKGAFIRAAILSDHLELSRPSITRILNSLESRGFITREIDKADRRNITMEATEKGIAQLQKANKALQGISQRLAGTLGEEDTERLIELIDRVAETYKQIHNEKGE